MTCIMFNHLTYLIGLQCVLAGNVHTDLHLLSYESVTAKSYSWYYVNGFHFRSTIFKASHPLAATTNTWVVTRAIDAEGHESKYYEIIKNIIEYNYAGNKNLKTMFFDCVGLVPIMVLEKTNLVWLKSNTRIGCVIATHLSLLTRLSKSIIYRTHAKS
jgi:hypothetical protein